MEKCWKLMDTASRPCPELHRSPRTAASAARIRGLLKVDAADPGPADAGGQRQRVKRAVGQEAGVDAVQGGGRTARPCPQGG